ncbi:hypothetical protein BDZ97DRAFT_1795109 [Flammula alnicola]|nr:hypothetical protein BDZ97DRAFT_1795109 [Flammula alnicola]
MTRHLQRDIYRSGCSLRIQHNSTHSQGTFSHVGSYKNLVSGEFPLPKLRANDVLVKVHAVSLQYRDLMIASGTYSAKTLENLVPCSDMAGEIIAVGEEVKGWKVSHRVCANFSTDHIHGPTTPQIQGTSLGGQAHGVLTQYRTFPAHAGDYVLVLGTGGVSIFGLQFAVASGATVIATSSSDEKLKIAAKLGAKHLINYRKTPNWDEEVNKITNGAGVDHIIEVGGGTLSQSINSARMGYGSIHIIGHVALEHEDPNIVFRVIRKAVTLRGILIGSVSQ